MSDDREQWLKWAMELQSLAQAGLHYSKEDFDLERFERIREISAEIMATKSGVSLDVVKNIFCNEIGYQTPKIDCRGAIIQNDKVLLVKERDDKWSLPGGWVDVNQSVTTNIIKEMLEEAGVHVKVKKVVAIQDGRKHNLLNDKRQSPYGVCKIFLLCEIIEGTKDEFSKNIEISEKNYFDINNLPELSFNRVNENQIKLCYEASKSKVWETVFE